MLLLCSCAFFFILNPKAFFSESFPFPMLFSSNFIIFMPVLHSIYSKIYKKWDFGIKVLCKSCGINRASQPTHERHSYILLISIKAVFSFFCAPWGWLHIYKLKSKIYVKNSAKEPGKIAENHENHRFKIIMIRQVFIYFNLVVFTIFGYFSWFLCRIFHINFTF